METNLSIKLKNLRKENKYSVSTIISKLSKDNLHYSNQSIYKWEQGESTPTIKVIISLAKIYHCKISYLIEEDEVTHINLTPNEIFLLNLFRNDFLFRNISLQILKRFERLKKQ